ncbi:phosphatase PAP2 family protein [Halostagnicola sp. A-GB9-2]|uniref:phosphatase PAP2 family protein n=1 Tax=Halostagnicola sp. A-GB9-2 TaxID=3048066 RepID=UPI0024BF6E11|nr:phosphatase PAP2 family protein [Halostagnicola sp. A-GB9-2]MDJ1433111.1 phosphatase PAP2 family protein [Halostagnicola sp. A-GB9-2]
MSRGIGVTEGLRETVPEWALEGFVGLSLLGDLAFIVPVLGLLYLTDVGWTIARDTEEKPLCSNRTVSFIAAVFGGLALVVFLKGVFAFPRPPAELHVISPSEHGFPSGHAMSATIFWGGFALWSSVRTRPSRFALAGTVVMLVSLSRLVLGVHFLVDVVASVLFGVVYLLVIHRVARGRPTRAFAVAIAIATLAVLATEASSRAVVALTGSVVAAIGWYFVELPAVRRQLIEVARRAETK